MPLNRKTVRARRLIFLSLVALTALAAGLYFLIRWNTHDRFYVTTDNAFVVGNIIPVQADATGVVAEVLVEETNKVKAGELLVRLDEQRAKAMLDQFAADLARAVRSVGGQFAARRQACQKIASQIALRDKTRHDVMRYRQALPSGAVSQQVLQNATDQLASLDAELHQSRADFQSFEARLGGLTLTKTPEIEAATAKFAENYIEFARQRIKAPVSGYIAKRKAQVGDRVRPGDLLMQIIPLDYLWIEANLWENSMQRVRPGQPVAVTVDLYGNSALFHGRVEGIIPGSGSVFALLAPDNATGNFIHIVQRVPVYISLRPDELEKQPLRPGLSTVVSIDVRDDAQSPNASITRMDPKAANTEIFANEIAEADTRAKKIVSENLVAGLDAAVGPCPSSEARE
jgi:membrane fusion protein (multidrug efflux system)